MAKEASSISGCARFQEEATPSNWHSKATSHLQCLLLEPLYKADGQTGASNSRGTSGAGTQDVGGEASEPCAARRGGDGPLAAVANWRLLRDRAWQLWVADRDRTRAAVVGYSKGRCH